MPVLIIQVFMEMIANTINFRTEWAQMAEFLNAEALEIDDLVQRFDRLGCHPNIPTNFSNR